MRTSQAGIEWQHFFLYSVNIFLLFILNQRIRLLRKHAIAFAKLFHFVSFTYVPYHFIFNISLATVYYDFTSRDATN